MLFSVNLYKCSPMREVFPSCPYSMKKAATWRPPGAPVPSCSRCCSSRCPSPALIALGIKAPALELIFLLLSISVSESSLSAGSPRLGCLSGSSCQNHVPILLLEEPRPRWILVLLCSWKIEQRARRQVPSVHLSLPDLVPIAAPCT